MMNNFNDYFSKRYRPNGLLGLYIYSPILFIISLVQNHLYLKNKQVYKKIMCPCNNSLANILLSKMDVLNKELLVHGKPVKPNIAKPQTNYF